MRNKILEITEKIPQTTTLPDGYYEGIWGGYVIEVRYNNKLFELKTEEGVKGIGFKVVVEIKNGIASFEEINK